MQVPILYCDCVRNILKFTKCYSIIKIFSTAFVLDDLWKVVLCNYSLLGKQTRLGYIS